MRVGLVGTGQMGGPLVHRLAAAEIDLSVFVRRPEARSDAERSGASCVDRLQALPVDRDVVIVYVYSDEQVREVVDGGLADAMEPGSVLVVHTTGSPRTAQAIAQHLARRDVGVVDAPGSGGPGQLAEGALTLFVGGERDHVELCRPLFDVYASVIAHVGPVGSGQSVKLLNNLLFGAQVELAAQAAELSEVFGVDPVLLASTLHSCSGASYALDLVAAMGSVRSLVEGAGRFVHKDVLTARELARELGSPLGSFAGVVEALLDRTDPSGTRP